MTQTTRTTLLLAAAAACLIIAILIATGTVDANGDYGAWLAGGILAVVVAKLSERFP